MTHNARYHRRSADAATAPVTMPTAIVPAIFATVSFPAVVATTAVPALASAAVVPACNQRRLSTPRSSPGLDAHRVGHAAGPVGPAGRTVAGQCGRRGARERFVAECPAQP
jgi:hypothetical protein